MSATAAALVKQGLRFVRVGTRMKLEGPEQLRALAVAERDRRAALFAPLLAARAPCVPMRIVAAPLGAGRAAYYGRCESCDDPMDKHRGGTCELCESAIRKCVEASGG